jgi:hypothetical protein
MSVPSMDDRVYAHLWLSGLKKLDGREWKKHVENFENYAILPS